VFPEFSLAFLFVYLRAEFLVDLGLGPRTTPLFHSGRTSGLQERTHGRADVWKGVARCHNDNRMYLLEIWGVNHVACHHGRLGANPSDSEFLEMAVARRNRAELRNITAGVGDTVVR